VQTPVLELIRGVYARAAGLEKEIFVRFDLVSTGKFCRELGVETARVLVYHH
jgi:hypothetical protein